MKSSIIFLFCYLAFAFSLNNNFQFDTRYFPKSVNAFPFDTPAVKEGLPTPLPKVWKTSNSVLNVQNSGFVFESTGSSCDDLTAAFERYYKILFDTPGESFNKDYSWSKAYRQKYGIWNRNGGIGALYVNVETSCSGKPMPAFGMDEDYTLNISSAGAKLEAKTLWGALRGLETFSQLVYSSSSGQMWYVNETMIEDGPRFPHRGFLVDTSRHYVEKNILLQFVSALSMAKYNVFHWHIVDSQSFPYQSRVYPDLSQKGAYNPQTHIYSPEDIADVIEYARQRGIRVVAEFDTPGHSLSWGPGQPGLLTPCYGSDGKPDGTFGPIDPSKNSTYEFIEKLFSEVSQVFPDQYLHLGGDEVSFTCWQSNPDIKAFMVKAGIADYVGLESYYISRVTDIVQKLNKQYIIWQEPVDNGVKLAKDTVVNIWKANPDPSAEMAKVTGKGYQSITSACWYLNRVAYGENWQSYYACDPQNFNGTAEQKALVMGGEGCMWGEWVDGTNLMSRTWPRAAVVAERLWSPATATDMDSMKVRLEAHRCRMIRRDLDANPIDPSYCRYEKQSPPPKY